MKEFNLKSSKEFGEGLKDCTDKRYRELRDNYDSFLDFPLKLEMFIPCDEEGNVLEELGIFEFIENIGGIDAHATEEEHEKHHQYQKAKEKCLFEGEWHIRVINNDEWLLNGSKSFLPTIIFMSAPPVEWLLDQGLDYDLELTETAKKKMLG